MGLASEFKQFAMKGNVVDMAVGVIIGAAFGKIVSSLVDNLIMPPLGMALSGVHFTDLAVTARRDAPMACRYCWKYGAFLQTTLDFLIIAFCLFLAIKAHQPAQGARAHACRHHRHAAKSCWKRSGIC